MSAVNKAKKAWGNSLPDWVMVMAEACDNQNQKRVAEQMCYSPAVINTVLSKTYKGDLIAVKQAVEGAFLAATVQCPIMGDLQANKCMENQRRPYAATNALRVRLYKACNSDCPNSRAMR